MSSTREVYEADAIAWLEQQELAADAAFVTSLPNVDEFQHQNLARWRTWFVDAAALVMNKTPVESAAVFFQTDIKQDGVWIDKSFLLQQAAERSRSALIWHKTVLRAPIGTTTNARPGYAHLLCFAPKLRSHDGNATADVLPQLGSMAWPRAMGNDVATFAISWLRDHAAARTIVAPFCGTGTALAVANKLGLHAIGIERSKSRAAKARLL
ncbi:MAG: hypothetical protein ACI8UD_000692 [Planctomycetota bacterium]